MSQLFDDSIHIRSMVEADIDAALELCQRNGWNQTNTDWRRLMDYQPAGCFAALVGNQLVGTVTTTSYQEIVGWIGMMLVHPEFRRRGIATMLLQRSLDFLDGKQVRAIKLDATPVGQKVYAPLGFEVEWTFRRWRRPAQASMTDESQQPSTSLSDALLQLDDEAFGVDRRKFIQCLARTSVLRTSDNAFGMLRSGRLADYLGPVCGRTVVDAEHVITELCRGTQRELFWDIPAPNKAAVNIARGLGFEPVRELTRMWRTSNVTGRTDLQYAIAGPATG